MADSRHPGDDDGGGEDRISNLPDDILHRILYYAGMRLAMQASVLSSQWRDLWRFMPHLNFDVQEFSGCPSPNKSLYDYAFWVRYFRHTEVRMQKVRLVRLHEPNPIKIIFGEDHLWVGDERFRIGAGLEELELCNVEHGDAADCLQTLRLLFGPWKNPYPNHYLAALRTFELWNCRQYKDKVFWLRENVWPVEEALFAHCNYRIVGISTGRLKILKLWHCGMSEGRFRVFAPNLVSLDCRRIHSSSLCLGSSPYVKEAFLDLMTDEGGAGSVIEILGAICNVKTLTLSSSIVKVSMFQSCDTIDFNTCKLWC